MERPTFPPLAELEAASHTFRLLTEDQKNERRRVLSKGLTEILKAGKEGFTAKQSHEVCKLLEDYLSFGDPPIAKNGLSRRPTRRKTAR